RVGRRAIGRTGRGGAGPDRLGGRGGTRGLPRDPHLPVGAARLTHHLVPAGLDDQRWPEASAARWWPGLGPGGSGPTTDGLTLEYGPGFTVRACVPAPRCGWPS